MGKSAPVSSGAGPPPGVLASSASRADGVGNQTAGPANPAARGQPGAPEAARPSRSRPGRHRGALSQSWVPLHRDSCWPRCTTRDQKPPAVTPQVTAFLWSSSWPQATLNPPSPTSGARITVYGAQESELRLPDSPRGGRGDPGGTGCSFRLWARPFSREPWLRAHRPRGSVATAVPWELPRALNSTMHTGAYLLRWFSGVLRACWVPQGNAEFSISGTFSGTCVEC